MPKVRNVTGETRECPWSTPQTLPDGAVGVVPQDVYDSLDWSHGMFELIEDKPKADKAA